MIAPAHRIGYIDGLRAVAVLLVVASHGLGWLPLGQSLGVTLFFVISGFCLSYPTLAKLQSSGNANYDVYSYGARRIVRIVPPYWIAIALLFVSSFFLVGITHVSPVDALRQALFLDQGTKLLAGPFWSLPVEFRWYFIFPIALWLWVKSPKALVTVAVLAAVASEVTRATSVDLLVLPAFLLGIVAAHVRLHGHRLAPLALPACGVMAVLAYLKTGFLPSPLWELSIFLFVVACGALVWCRVALSFKVLTAIGLASYSIYLIHAPIILISEAHGVSPTIAMVLGVAGGFIFWFFAERPFLDPRLRNRIVGEFVDTFTRWSPKIGIGRILRLGDSPHDVDRENARTPDRRQAVRAE